MAPGLALAQVRALPSVVCSQSSLDLRMAPGLAFGTGACSTTSFVQPLYPRFSHHASQRRLFLYFLFLCSLAWLAAGHDK